MNEPLTEHRMRNQCLRKKAYSGSELPRVLRSIERRFKRPMSSYLCDICGKYHLTKQIKPRPQHVAEVITDLAIRRAEAIMRSRR